MQGFQELPEIVHCFRNWSSICARMILSKEFLHVKIYKLWDSNGPFLASITVVSLTLGSQF
jgi:hypothetical protein